MGIELGMVCCFTFVGFCVWVCLFVFLLHLFL